MKIIKQFKLVILILAGIYLAGCTMPKTSISSLKEVQKGEIIVVGKMQLNPHIKKNEVIYKNYINLSDQELHEVLYMKATDKFYDLSGGHSLDMGDSVAVIDGKYFYITWPKNKPLHILGTSFITRSTGRNLDTMTFTIKKGIKVSFSKRAKAIYVGTVTFNRDEFWNIKKIDISQKGFAKARRAFRKKYKTKMKFEKARLSSSR